MSTSVVESWWVLPISLAAKCSDAPSSTSTLSLLSLLLLLLLSFLATALLHWSSPGGPAWGRYYWSTKCSGPSAGHHHTNIPGPRGLPLLGSMGLMTNLAHRHLRAAAEQFSAAGGRRLMAFSLGGTRAVVTGDPAVAREILNSPAFVARPTKESAYRLMFGRAIGFAPYGAYWRFLRHIAAAHLFSPRQISVAEPQRSHIAAHMVSSLIRTTTDGTTTTVRVRDVLKQGSLSNIMRSVFGFEYEITAAEGSELMSLVDEGYDLLGKLNYSDHLPFLAALDLQGIRSRCSRLVPRVNRLVNRIIEDHRSKNRCGAAQDFVDVLLSLQAAGDGLSDSDMAAVLWEMVFRGTDTVAVLMEWVLARLVLHPEVQRVVHKELDRVVGRSRPVLESDTPSLVYLNAVVKEVLRMHPPGPLLSWARLATCDVVVDGRHVPAGTTAMVNMWAITHDPSVWAEPERFRPERFVGEEEQVVLGSDLRLAPFGAGRRSCPGKALAMATVSFWVATLLHEFEWLPPPPPDDDWTALSEVLRLSCEMAVPLAAVLRPRRTSPL